MIYNHKRPVTKSRFSRPLPIISIGLLCIVLCASVLEFTNTTYLFHTKPVPKTATITSTSQHSTSKPSTDKTNPSPTTTPQTTPIAGSDNKGDSDTPQQSSTPTGAAPATPSGTFLSNHSPSLDGDPYPSGEQSVCTTTPGAKCSMTFTNGELTRTLQEQTTNSDGNAFWTWDVKQSAFTEGTWTVTITTTLNGQTSAAKDSLKVGP
jgi:hypothetical protein